MKTVGSPTVFKSPSSQEGVAPNGDGVIYTPIPPGGSAVPLSLGKGNNSRHPAEKRDLVSHDECREIPRFRGMTTKKNREIPAFAGMTKKKTGMTTKRKKRHPAAKRDLVSLVADRQDTAFPRYDDEEESQYDDEKNMNLSAAVFRSPFPMKNIEDTHFGHRKVYIEFSKITFYNVTMLRFVDNFYLVRHGQTDKNKKGEVQGLSDEPLNSIGMAQAAALIPIAQKIGITGVITSDLLRAEKTGSIIANGLGIEITKTPLLRECDFGNLTGAKHVLFNQETVKRIQTETKINKAESIDDVFRRVKNFLDDLRCDSKTLIVSHGGTMRFIMYYMENNGKIDKNAFIQYACTTHIPNAQIFAFTTQQKFEMVR